MSLTGLKFYVAFYKSNNKYAKWDDKLINWWTGKNGYSHCEIVVDNRGEMTMFSSSGRDGGVRCRPHNYNTDVWDYIEVDLSLKHIFEIFHLTENQKYDWFGILGFIFPFKDRTFEWFCSEWCSNVLKTYGNEKLLLLEPSKLSPNKFYRVLTGSKSRGIFK